MSELATLQGMLTRALGRYRFIRLLKTGKLIPMWSYIDENIMAPRLFEPDSLTAACYFASLGYGFPLLRGEMSYKGMPDMMRVYGYPGRYRVVMIHHSTDEFRRLLWVESSRFQKKSIDRQV